MKIKKPIETGQYEFALSTLICCIYDAFVILAFIYLAIKFDNFWLAIVSYIFIQRVSFKSDNEKDGEDDSLINVKYHHYENRILDENDMKDKKRKK